MGSQHRPREAQNLLCGKASVQKSFGTSGIDNDPSTIPSETPNPQKKFVRSLRASIYRSEAKRDFPEAWKLLKAYQFFFITILSKCYANVRDSESRLGRDSERGGVLLRRNFRGRIPSTRSTEGTLFSAGCISPSDCSLFRYLWRSSASAWSQKNRIENSLTRSYPSSSLSVPFDR